jgi:hypothetical protein
MQDGRPVFVNKGNAFWELDGCSMAIGWGVSSIFESTKIRDSFTFMAGIAKYRLGKMVAHLYEEVNIPENFTWNGLWFLILYEITISNIVYINITQI